MISRPVSLSVHEMRMKIYIYGTATYGAFQFGMRCFVGFAIVGENESINGDYSIEKNADILDVIF